MLLPVRFDRQRRLDVMMLFFVVLAAVKFVLNIELVQDILMGDESLSLEAGVELPRLGLRDPSWSPLYSVWYYFLSLFESDRVRLYDLNYEILVVAIAALFYLLLRAMKTNVYISATASIWLLLSTVTSSWPYNGLFALVIVLLCLNAIARISSEENAYLVLGVSVTAVIFVRPEFLVSLILVLGALAWYHWTRRDRFDWRSATKAATLVGTVVVLFHVFGNPMGESGKAWGSFGQAFTVNYVQRHGVALVPWFEWREVIRATFGDANSAWTAAINNSGAFTRHVMDNVVTYTLATILGPLMAPLACVPPRVHGALALLQFGVLSGLGLFLVREIARDKEIVTRVFARRLVVAALVVVSPNLVAALVVYPRWHYLSIQTSLLLAVGAALLSRIADRAVMRPPTFRNVLIFGTALIIVTPNISSGWLPIRGDDGWPSFSPQKWSREREQQIAARRFAWSFPTKVVFMNYWTGGRLLPLQADAVLPTGILENRAIIATVRSLRIDAPVNLLVFLQPYRAYLGDNYHDVEHRQKASTPFLDFLQQVEINMILVSDKLRNSPSFADDPEFRDFLRDPVAHGFRRIEIPTVDGWLLVKQDLEVAPPSPPSSLGLMWRWCPRSRGQDRDPSRPCSIGWPMEAGNRSCGIGDRA